MSWEWLFEDKDILRRVFWVLFTVTIMFLIVLVFMHYFPDFAGQKMVIQVLFGTPKECICASPVL